MTTSLLANPRVSFSLSAIITWLFLGLILPFLRQNLLDRPNSRSIHNSPIPRGGGIVFVGVSAILAPLSNTGWVSLMPIICLPLAIIGLLDDFLNLPASLRFVFQLITSLVLAFIATPDFPLFLYPFIVLAVISIINFTNFMDGIDGLVAVNSAIIITSIILITEFKFYPQAAYNEYKSMWIVVGALTGFLPWNWSPAKVFMGDVGSTFLGALLAGVSLQQQTLLDALSILMLGFPLFADAAFCLLQRLVRGESIFQPHKKHLYQRLYQAGWSHQKITIVYAMSTCLLAASYFIGGSIYLVFTIIFVFLSGLYLNRYVAVPFSA